MTGAVRQSEGLVAQTAASKLCVVPFANVTGSNPAVGDSLVVFLTGEETTPVFDTTVNAGTGLPAGWVDITPTSTNNPSRTNSSIKVICAAASSTDVTNTTVTAPFTTSKARVGAAMCYAGPSMFNALTSDGVHGSNYTAVLTMSDTVTTVFPNDLAIYATATQSAVTYTTSTPTGFTAGPSGVSTPTGQFMALFDLLDTGAAGSAITPVTTWTGTSRNGVSVLLTFRAAVAAALSGTGTLTVSGAPAIPGGAALSGVGTLSALSSGPAGGCALSGSGTLGLTFVPATTGAAVLSGAGTLTAAVSVDRNSIGGDGDSLTYQAGAGVAATIAYLGLVPGWPGTIMVTADIGRFVWNAGDTNGGTPALLAAWQAAGFNPYDLLFLLGTNDDASAVSSNWAPALSNLRAGIATYLPGPHRIWWVNIVADSTGGQGMDGVIGTKGNSIADYNTFLAGNLNGTTEKIIDWNTYAKANATSSSYWQNDSLHVHMTTAGYAVRNAFIQSQMQLVAPLQAAAFTGAGTLTASGGPQFPGSAGFSGAGTLTAGAKPILTTGAAMSGAGTLGVGGKPILATGAALSGAGALTAAAAPAIPGAAGLSGVGTLTGAATPAIPTSAALSGVGTLTALGGGTIAGAAGFTGVGTLSAAGVPAAPGAAGLSGVGTLSTAGKPALATGAALSGVGTLTASGGSAGTGTASLSGAGALTTAGVPSQAAGAGLSGLGVLTAAAAAAMATGAALTGLGVLAAGGSPFVRGSAFLAGSGQLQATGGTSAAGSAMFTGSGQLAIVGQAHGVGAKLPVTVQLGVQRGPVVQLGPQPVRIGG